MCTYGCVCVGLGTREISALCSCLGRGWQIPSRVRSPPRPPGLWVGVKGAEEAEEESREVAGKAGHWG